MKINRKFIYMKLHYFFLMGGTAPLVPLLPLYMLNNLGISYLGLGLIYTCLPFLGLIAKSFSGTLSDYFHAHRQIFLASIAVCGLAYFSIYFCPPMPLEDNQALANVQFDCSSVSYMRYDLPNHCGQEDKVSLEGVATCEIVCKPPAETVNYLCRSWEIAAANCVPEQLEFSAFSNLSHMDVEKTTAFFPIQNLSYMGTEVNAPSCVNLTHLTNCTTRCDNDSVMTYLGTPLKTPFTTYQGILSKSQFWIFFICISLAWCGFAVSVVMSDTICFQLLESDAHLYGRQRMFGSMGWGLLAILTGYLIDAVSGSSVQKDYTPAFVLSLCVLSVDFLVSTRLKVQPKERNEISMKAVLKVIINPRILLFIQCCIVVGVSTGVLWTYQLVLVEHVAYAWDCDFGHMKLLQGLIMGVQCFFGELPFFFISGKIIEKLGHANAMSLAILAFGIRFMLYYTVTNPWLFLPIELFNGLTFGIFYAVMTSYANIVAPAGAHATLQGIVGASFEGIGMAIGAFVGASMFYSMPGGLAFLYIGIFNTCVAVVHVLLQAVLDKLSPHESKAGGGYSAPAEVLTED